MAFPGQHLFFPNVNDALNCCILCLEDATLLRQKPYLFGNSTLYVYTTSLICGYSIRDIYIYIRPVSYADGPYADCIFSNGCVVKCISICIADVKFSLKARFIYTDDPRASNFISNAHLNTTNFLSTTLYLSLFQMM